MSYDTEIFGQRRRQPNVALGFVLGLGAGLAIWASLISLLIWLY
jgi:hypothetical protein